MKAWAQASNGQPPSSVPPCGLARPLLALLSGWCPLLWAEKGPGLSPDLPSQLATPSFSLPGLLVGGARPLGTGAVGVCSVLLLFSGQCSQGCGGPSLGVCECVPGPWVSQPACLCCLCGCLGDSNRFACLSPVSVCPSVRPSVRPGSVAGPGQCRFPEQAAEGLWFPTWAETWD